LKNAMIFPFKKTWRSRLDLEYLDENSECKISSRQHYGEPLENSNVGKRLKQFIDYALKETLGQVYAGGFFHNLILLNEGGTRSAPSELQQSATQATNFASVVRPPPQIFHLIAKSHHSTPPYLHHVEAVSR